MIDDYRKGWALRYIREAKDELEASHKTSQPLGLIVDAARKAQAAIYFSLGDPPTIESIVSEVPNDLKVIETPTLRCLVEIERSLRRMESLLPSAYEEALKEANEIVRVASEIVDLMACGD